MATGSSGEREYALLVAELRALDEEIESARSLARGGGHGPALSLRAQRDRPHAPSGEHVRLADGSEIAIRPVQAADRQQLDEGFRHLGALSRLRTVGEPVQQLTPRQLSELTEVDHDFHEAFVALDVATGAGIAFAQFVRSPEDPARAEFTCTVTDRWQGRGVGTALVKRLAARAQAIGIKRFTTVIVVGNERARRLLRRVASELSEHREGGKILITGVSRDA